MDCANCCKKQPPNIKFLVCSECKNIHYCSKECQIKNWRSHKELCRYAKQINEKIEKNQLAKKYTKISKKWLKSKEKLLAFLAVHMLNGRDPQKHIIFCKIENSLIIEIFAGTDAEYSKTFDIVKESKFENVWLDHRDNNESMLKTANLLRNAIIDKNSAIFILEFSWANSHFTMYRVSVVNISQTIIRNNNCKNLLETIISKINNEPYIPISA